MKSPVLLPLIVIAAGLIYQPNTSAEMCSAADKKDMRNKIGNTVVVVRDMLVAGDIERPLGIGSGSVVSPNGHIVTNEHVVHLDKAAEIKKIQKIIKEGNDRLSVGLANKTMNEDEANAIKKDLEELEVLSKKGEVALEVDFNNGTVFPAKVISQGEFQDLAVIQVDKKTPVYESFSNDKGEELDLGDEVIAIGHPFQLKFSVSFLRVANINRSMQVKGSNHNRFIQLDGAINPGNSGGPLFACSGKGLRVVGINSAGITSTGQSSGVGLAIPGDLVHNFIQQVITNGKYHSIKRLGVVIKPVKGTTTQPYGIVVDKVSEEKDSKGNASLANKIGLQKGDHILKYNGTNLQGDLNLLIALVQETTIFQSIEMEIERSGQIFPVRLAPSLNPLADVVDSDDKEKKVAKAEDTQNEGVQITSDELAFLTKTFQTRFEGEFQAKNFADVNKVIGGKSFAIVTSQNPQENSIELHLDLSEKETVKVKGPLTLGQIVTLTDSKQNQVRLACADDKCDFLLGYAFVEAGQNKDLLGTFFLKRSGDRHLPVKSDVAEETAESVQQQAEKNYIIGLKDIGLQVISDLKKKIKVEGAWYSPYPFLVGMNSEKTALTLLDGNKFKIELERGFVNHRSLSRSLPKDIKVSGVGVFEKELVMRDEAKQISMIWEQKNGQFSWGIYKTEKYKSKYEQDKREHKAYFIFFCGFASVTVNNTVYQVDHCENFPSSTFLDGRGEGPVLDVR